MAQLIVNTGTIANDGTGDTLRGAAIKINTNFSEIYTTVGATINIVELKSIVANSTDFVDFQSRIAAL